MTALAEHMLAGVTTVCRAWILTRTDGVVLGFTDHDADLEVDGIVCAAASGLTAGALDKTNGLSVDNVEASGMLTHDAIDPADIRAGRWDDAEVVIWLMNWAEPDARELTFRGHLGEIAMVDGAFVAELRGLSDLLNQSIGRLYQPRCDAVLGDARCGLALDARFMVEVEVEAVEGGRLFTFAGLRDFAPKWFERGELIVLDGAAAGLVDRIKIDRVPLDGVGRSIELWASFRADVAAGDRVRLVAGCDKRHETCQFKFDNLLNFRGFPHVPGEDWMMTYPSSGSHNDGGRG